MPLVDFSSEQLRQLRKVIRSELTTLSNTPHLPDTVENDHQAPEVYVALVPSAGIDAVDYVGTGTGTSTGTELQVASSKGDTPSSVECDIFFLDLNLETLVSTGKTETVYNLQGARLTGPQWISVHRDKFGRWYAITGGDTTCDSQNEIQQLVIFGSPTGGTLTLYLEVNDVLEGVTVNWDDTGDEVEIALQTHSEISNVGTATGSPSDDLTVTGGPLPDAPVRVQFIGDFATTAIELMYADFSGLTGGTGVGVIVFRERAGRA
ncbi:hypothetical protein OAG36_00675 [bacterium]|nr:hypothetical protein [bacterium]